MDTHIVQVTRLMPSDHSVFRATTLMKAPIFRQEDNNPEESVDYEVKEYRVRRFKTPNGLVVSVCPGDDTSEMVFQALETQQKEIETQQKEIIEERRKGEAFRFEIQNLKAALEGFKHMSFRRRFKFLFKGKRFFLL